MMVRRVDILAQCSALTLTHVSFLLYPKGHVYLYNIEQVGITTCGKLKGHNNPVLQVDYSDDSCWLRTMSEWPGVGQDGPFANDKVAASQQGFENGVSLLE